MPPVVMISMLRNALDPDRHGGPYLDRYFRQLDRARKELGGNFHAVSIEGDSTDDTWPLLQGWAEHRNWTEAFSWPQDTPYHGSVDTAERWKNLGAAWNRNFDYLRAEWPGCTVVYMEADLRWKPDDILRLLQRLDESEVDAVSPWVWIRRSEESVDFYDCYGHRAHGINFACAHPYHPMFREERELYPLDSAGSCMAMTWNVVKHCRFGDDAMIGPDINAKGMKLWLDRKVAIWHPSQFDPLEVE